MKKAKIFQKKKSKVLTVLLAIFISSIFFFNSRAFYKLWNLNIPIGARNINIERFIPFTYLQIQKITHQFNIKKAVLKRGYVDGKHNISIELSSEDIKNFQNFYYDSTQIKGLKINMKPGNINKGFLVDEINSWRKARVIFPGLPEQKVKIKLHGTSPSPIMESVSLFNRLKWKILKKINPNDFDISRGGFAFKIKISSEDIYYKQKRRLNLLTPWDQWNSVQNSLNNYFKEFGVITTSGEVKRLFINGHEIGPYLVVENIDKELLERDFNITNFALFKNNDDWNKGVESAHISSTDYTSFDMEQSGENFTFKIAQTKLQSLMDGILYKDIELLTQLVDIDNLAKISALINITGSTHPILGDNTKYVYDFATGRFQLTYRIENDIYNIKPSYPAYFDKKKFITGDMHKLIKIFLEQKWFLDKRNSYLQDLINDKDNIFASIKTDYENNSKIFEKTNFPTRQYNFLYDKYLSNLKNNFSNIESYLNYTKIYTTLMEKNDEFILNILHDSYTPTLIKSITSCDGLIYLFDKPINLSSALYEKNSFHINHIKSSTKVEIPFNCISSIDAIKLNSNKKVEQKNVYINYASYIDFVSNSGLDQLKGGLVISSDKEGSPKTYKLRRGEYIIEKDIIFPNNSSVIFESGVSLILHPNISVLIRGDFIADGHEDSQVSVFSNTILNEPFGTFAIMGSPSMPVNVKLNFFNISGGSEDIINGTYLSSQLSIHHSKTTINNSYIHNSLSDDGLNIKFSELDIRDSFFYNNYADQIDLDYSNGIVRNNEFYFNNNISPEIITDGLDISGSKVYIYDNSFTSMTDKGISVGESSNALIFGNFFEKNNNAIAVKDNSTVLITQNLYNENTYDINAYIKKKMYDKPKIYYEEKSFLNINTEHQNDYQIYDKIPSKFLEEISKIRSSDK